MTMTLIEVIDCLLSPCCTTEHGSLSEFREIMNTLDNEVVFDTADRSGLTLLSCYVHKGKVHIDIGTGDL